MNFDDIQVGGTLRVGTGVCPAIKDGDEGINGAVYAEGPVVFGTQLAFPQEQATLMVARTENKDPDCEPADRSLWVKGNSRFEGDDGTKYTLNVTGDVTIVGNTDQTGNIKAAPKIMENAGVTTITNSGINSFQRPNMREVAGEYLPFNVNNLGNPTNDKRVVSEELGMTGFGTPNMRNVAGKTNIDRFSNTVAPAPSTPEIYQDLIMNPEYMPNRLQNLERFADNRFKDLDFQPGFDFKDAPNKVTNLKELYQNKEYLNNPNVGIIDNMILSRGNPEKSLFN